MKTKKIEEKKPYEKIAITNVKQNLLERNVTAGQETYLIGLSLKQIHNDESI